jgi:hypothetical protein
LIRELPRSRCRNRRRTHLQFRNSNGLVRAVNSKGYRLIETGYISDADAPRDGIKFARRSYRSADQATRSAMQPHHEVGQTKVERSLGRTPAELHSR